jgi:glutathione S-transferase
MKLYYAPNTRAGLCRWLLEEAAIPYELEFIDLSKPRPAWYRRIHPHARVPALVDGDVTLHESAAICMYIADKVPERGLAPPVGTTDRGRYYQWIVYSVVTASEPFSKVLLHTVLLPESKRRQETARKAREKWVAVADVLSEAVKGRAFLLGDRLTAADVLVGGVLFGAAGVGLLASHEELIRYVESLAARPAFQRS